MKEESILLVRSLVFSLKIFNEYLQIQDKQYSN
jgi:hypothetical protein